MKMSKPKIHTFRSSGLSLNRLYQKNKDLFYSDWFKFKDEGFAKTRGKPKIIHLLTELYPNSTNKTFEEGKALIKKDEYIPTAREVVEGMISYYRKNKVKLFGDFLVRTADVSSHGLRVSVKFYSGGVSIDYYWDDHRYSGLGLAVARKFIKPRKLGTSGKPESTKAKKMKKTKPATKKEKWEKEFNDAFVWNEYGLALEWRGDNLPVEFEEMKSFIRRALAKARQEAFKGGYDLGAKTNIPVKESLTEARAEAYQEGALKQAEMDAALIQKARKEKK